MKSWICPLVLCLLPMVALGGEEAPPTTQPATQVATQARETIPEMEARLAKLKSEVAALEAKIEAAKRLTAKQDDALVAQLNALPKNLWPSVGEQSIKSNTREKWLDSNVIPGRTYTFTGVITSLNGGGTSPGWFDESGKLVKPKPFDGIYVKLDCGKVTVWGHEVTLTVDAPVTNVAPEKAVDWPKAKVITVSGPSESVFPKISASGGEVHIYLKASRMK